jgi:Na+/H+ antiporter NhaC
VGLLTIAVSAGIFLESTFSLLVSGSVARPLFDKCRISREKLAYIIDATCAPKLILIPLNAWGAYIAGLLLAQDVVNVNALLAGAVALNFYAILAILLVLAVVLTGWDIGPMREAERRVAEEGKLLRDGAEPMVSTDVTLTEPKEGVPLRAANMVLPILVMVVTVPIVLLMTGDGDVRSGSGSQAVLWGVIVGLMVAVMMFRLQGILTIKESTDHAMTRALGTGEFVAEAARRALNPGFVPALVFLLACFIAFSTGTSWGTFAIMIPIVMPMIEVLDLHPALAVAAALGGGIFGDHCSPISDTTIVASMASATDHIDHVRTQLPYALIAAGGATVLCVLFGFLL